MYILVLESEGDYDDFYQRGIEPIKVSKSKEILKKFVDSLPTKERNRDNQKFIIYKNELYINYQIYEIEQL
jgi:hypothetical protein